MPDFSAGSELSAGYMLASVLVALAVTFTLRALPFAILEPLRNSAVVQLVAVWMPAGILTILVLYSTRQTAADAAGGWLEVLVASLVTVAVHLLGGRRMLLSILLGTLSYVLLLNFM